MDLGAYFQRLLVDQDARSLAIDLAVPLLATLVGAAAAILTQAYVLHRQERDRRLALACAVTFKMHDATDFLVQMSGHVIEARKEAAKIGADLWTAMKKLGGVQQERIVFDAEELTLFAVHKEASYINDLQQVMRAHNILISLLVDYHARRDEFGAWMSQHAQVAVSGSVVSAATSNGFVELLVLQLRDLAEGIEDTAINGAKHAKETNAKLSPKLKAMLDDPRFTLSVSFPEEATAEAQSKAAESKPSSDASGLGSAVLSSDGIHRWLKRLFRGKGAA